MSVYYKNENLSQNVTFPTNAKALRSSTPKPRAREKRGGLPVHEASGSFPVSETLWGGFQHERRQEGENHYDLFAFHH